MIGKNRRKKKKTKKIGEDKFDYREKTVEMSKVLIASDWFFLGAMTIMIITLLMNLIMKSKESKLLYYGQAVLS